MNEKEQAECWKRLKYVVRYGRHILKEPPEILDAIENAMAFVAADVHTEIIALSIKKQMEEAQKTVEEAEQELARG